jgi:hypothetical protein
MQAILTQAVLADVPVVPARVLAYEPRRTRRRERERAHTWWAAASIGMAAVTFAYAGVCAAGVRATVGWDLLAWLVYGFIGTWIGCAIGALLALIGCVQWTRLRRRALLALLVNLALAGAHYAFVCAILLPSLADRPAPSSGVESNVRSLS